MNTKRAYYILPTTVTSNVCVCVCVCVRACVCVCLNWDVRGICDVWFATWRGNQMSTMCRSTCGPKNSSLSSCRTQAVRLTLHFLTYVWHITETKTIKKWECGKDNQSELFRLFSEMCPSAVWAAATLCFAGLWWCLWTLHHLGLCMHWFFFLLSYVCNFIFIYNKILCSNISRIVYQQRAMS